MLLALAANAGADPVLQHREILAAQSPASRVEVVPDPRGGVSVAVFDEFGRAHGLHRYSATLQPLGFDSEPLLGAPFAMHSDGSVVESNNDAVPPVPGLSGPNGADCLAARSPGGVAYRRIFSAGVTALTPPDRIDSQGGFYTVADANERQVPLRYAPDCSALAVPQIELDTFLLDPDPLRIGAYLLAGETISGGARYTQLISATEFAPRWFQVLPTAFDEIPTPQLRAAPLGGVWIAGKPLGSDEIRVTYYSDGRERLWERSFPLASQIDLAAAGSFLVLSTHEGDATTPAPAAIRVIDVEGNITGEAQLGNTLLPRRVPAHDPAVAIIATGVDPRPTSNSLENVQLLYQVLVDGKLSTLPALQPGRRAVAITREGTLIAQNYGRSATQPMLLARAPEAPDDTSIAIDAPEPANPLLEGSVSIVDAAGTLLLARQFEAEEKLVQLAPDGSPRWRHSLPATQERRVIVDADRACVEYLPAGSAERRVRCLDRNHGAQLFDTAWPQAMSPLLTLDAQHVLHGFTVDPNCGGTNCDSRLLRSAIDAAGQSSSLPAIEVTGAKGALMHAVQADDGRYVLTWGGTAPRRVSVHAADGTLLHSFARAADLSAAVALGLDAAGNVLLGLRPAGTDDWRLTLLANDGSVRWNRTVRVNRAASTPPALPVGSDWLLLPPPEYTTQAPFLPLRLRGSDGSTLWQLPASSRDGLLLQTSYAIDPTSAKLARAAMVVPLATQAPRGARIDWFALDSGNSLGAQDLLADALAHVQPIAFADDGTLRVVTQHELPAQQEVRTFRVDSPAAASGDLAAERADLLGTWSSSLGTGQGFYFDYDAANDSLYGAWFTYTQQPNLLASELRWYTLIADAPAADGGAHIKIYRSAGGAFGTAPATVTVAVGEGTLRRLGCDRAQFDYRFVEGVEAGVSGSIPLRRALAASRNCTSGDAPAPSRGLDARSSGAWYDPTISGQGLGFDLRPPQGNDGGLFVGAWFTFDVSNRSDDPTSNHWFTLAGPLDAAQAGMFSVPIYRTMGGSLDGEPSTNSWRVGTATLLFTACDRMTFDYVIDDTDLAQQFAAKEGRLNLARVGGCGD